MLISNLLLPNDFEEYKIIKEKEFDNLALVDSKTQISTRTCIFLENEKYILKIPPEATMVITNESLAKLIFNDVRGTVITENPKLFFFSLHNHMSDIEGYSRKEKETVVGKNSNISPNAYIADKNVCIGENVLIEPFAIVHSNVMIGNNTIIRSGAIIGGNGFEFKRNGKEVLSVKHLGGVLLGENVEIQNGSCVDKAIYPWDNTVINDFTKLDNMVHIGHGAKIGKRVLFAASSTISGRVEIGDDAWIGVGSTISNGLSIGKNARVNIGAVVTKNVNSNESVTGNFAISHKKFIANLKMLQ